MRTFKVARPTEEHIKEMIGKAIKVNLKQIDVLLQNGFVVEFVKHLDLSYLNGKKGVVKRGNK